MIRLPVIGWLVSFGMSFALAIPFCFMWGYIGPKYFPGFPVAWQSIPFWDSVWMFMLLPIAKYVLGCLTPRLLHMEQSQKTGDTE